MPFGGQTIGLVDTDQTGTPDELGNYTLTKTTTDAPGCRHRPLTFRETAERELDIQTEWWQSTIPIHEYGTTLQEALLSLEGNDLIAVDGVEYQIIGGVRCHPDMDGTPFKVTILSKKHVG